MAAGEESYEDRTEEATAQRRDDWKKEGRVVQSRELSGAILLLSITGALWGATRISVGGIWSLFEETLGEASKLATKDWNVGLVMSLASQVFYNIAYILGPVAITAVAVSIVVSVAQTGFVWTAKPLEFDLNKVSPLRGIQRIFSMDGLVEMFKAIIKFIVIGVVVFTFLKKRIGEAGSLWNSEPSMISLYLGKNLLLGLIAAAFSMLVMAALDFSYQKFRYEQQIRMTKQEVREERKQSEGNPQIKARIRALQKRVATNKMLDAVKKADVVVTNPTHIAVALQYDRDNMFAPRVVAKGADFMAEKIKKIARENGIPCVENVPLARAMYKALKIGQFISRDLYNAVAEVLAYVYRLKGKANV